ncbi:MAG: translocation and assembly module TamB [Methyloprofundus sp.]|nr:MAG: translocation and assembly module TamB [Methyloprofundus sp.]
MRWYRAVLRLILMAVLSTFLVFVLLIYSSKFNRWLLPQLIKNIPELEIKKIDGSLLGELRLQQIKYSSEQVELCIESVAYQYSLAALMQGEALFDYLHINGVELVVHLANEVDTPAKSTDFVMPIALIIQDLLVQKLTVRHAAASYQLDKISLSLLYQAVQLRLDSVVLESELGQLQGNAELQLLENLPFTSDVSITKAVSDLGMLNLHVSLTGDQDNVYLDADLRAPSSMQAQGWVRFSSAEPQFELQLVWDELQWPLQGVKQYASEQMRLTLQGTADQYSLLVDTEFLVESLANRAQLHLEAEGNSKQLAVQVLNMQVFGGNIESTGVVSWTDELASRLQVEVNNLQLQQIFPESQGELSLDAQLVGEFFNNPDIAVDFQAVRGHVMDKELSAQAKLHYQKEQVELNFLQASVGNNMLNAHGSFGNGGQLQFALHAMDLHELNVDLLGAVSVDGVIHDALQQPELKINVESHGLQYQDYKVGSLQGRLAFSALGSGKLALDINAQQISLFGSLIDKLELHNQGDFIDHSLQAQISTAQGKLDFIAKGGWHKDQYWQGSIQQLQFQDTPIGDWQLLQESPLHINVAQQNDIQVQTKLCLAQQGATGLACLHAYPDIQLGQLFDGDIRQFPLMTLTRQLSAEFQIESYLQAHFAVQTQPSLQAKVNMSLQPGAFIFQDKQFGVQRLSFAIAEFDAKLLQGELQTELSVLFNDESKLAGQVNILGIEQLSTAQLAGDLKLRLQDIQFLQVFMVDVSDLGGKIDAHLQLSGSLQAPILEGSQLHLKQAKLRVQSLGLLLNNIDMSIKAAESERLALLARADIGAQTISITGQTERYASEQLQFSFAIQGEDLQVLQVPEMQLWVSPDLQLIGDRQAAKLTGQLLVPKAMIAFNDLPEGAVALSADEVLIVESELPQQVSAYPLNADIDIKLGDAVSIEGFGLKAKLAGQLRALQQANQFKLFNELKLVDGTYQAYGQDLSIEKGQLLFTGNVENPEINMLASRKASDWDDNTMAYLRMTGGLKAPETEVYTEPATSESESLAYLLTGAPLSKSGGSSAGLLAKAAIGLGRDYIDAVMGVVGVDEFEVKSTSVGENSVVLGKRIAPNLYTRYIVDVLTSQMQFAVEYKLTKNISIEVRSGSTHSSDIKYNIEFD